MFIVIEIEKEEQAESFLQWIALRGDITLGDTEDERKLRKKVFIASAEKVGKHVSEIRDRSSNR